MPFKDLYKSEISSCMDLLFIKQGVGIILSMFHSEVMDFHLRGCVTVLEIVFVGQCEVFVCLDFVHFFFPLGHEVHRSTIGVTIL